MTAPLLEFALLISIVAIPFDDALIVVACSGRAKPRSSRSQRLRSPQQSVANC